MLTNIHGKISMKETMAHIWEKKTQYEEKVQEVRGTFNLIYIFTSVKFCSLFLCSVCLEHNKHSMFLHCKKHYVLPSSKTCIKACLAKNTKPWSFSKSKLKVSMCDSKIIPFNSKYSLNWFWLPHLKPPTNQPSKTIPTEMFFFSPLIYNKDFFFKQKINPVHAFT